MQIWDRGRPWCELARGFDEQLTIDAQLAMETRTAIEKTIRGHNKCYLRRVQVSRRRWSSSSRSTRCAPTISRDSPIS